MASNTWNPFIQQSSPIKVTLGACGFGYYNNKEVCLTNKAVFSPSDLIAHVIELSDMVKQTVKYCDYKQIHYGWVLCSWWICKWRMWLYNSDFNVCSEPPVNTCLHDDVTSQDFNLYSKPFHHPTSMDCSSSYFFFLILKYMVTWSS